MGGKNNFLFKYLLLWCLCLCLIGGMTGQVLAQEDTEEFVLEEIVVTGSRIVRNIQESPSPIVTVDEKLFKQSATMAIETQLNKLPQFTPTMDVPTFGGDIQPTVRNTPGEATISLRGIGANRTLVLINGRRGTPANGAMYVDINTIPMAAIEYVEAISGGASATYGADAMAGVTNFIMREDFVGFELDAQSGLTQEGDNFEYQVSGIMGTDFADDRGNISLAFSTNRREDAMQIDRKWYRELYSDPQVGSFPTRQFFTPFSGITTYGNPEMELFPGSGNWGLFVDNLPDIDVLNTVIDGATFTTMANWIDIYVDENGQAFTGFGMGYDPIVIAGKSGADVVDGFEVIELANGMLAYTNLDNYLILPLERYNIYTSGNYEFNDWIGVFMQGYFSKTFADTVQEPAPITRGWQVFVDPAINRDVIPAELLTILDSRPYPDAPFLLKALLPFNRTGHSEVFTYNIVAGFEGRIPQIDWTYEIFVSRGEAETTSLMGGFGSLQRFDAIINGGPNFGQGIEIQGNTGAPNFGFGANTATCTSGLNPFDWGSVTRDCWNAILADIKAKQVMEQTIWEANLQGSVAELPAGEMKGALGYSMRKNFYEFMNDTLTTEGRSFFEQALGLYPAENSVGLIETDEVYGEVLVPVLKDLPFMKQFNLELGGRRSDYNTTGSTYTYKVLGDWRTNDWLRFRGGYNRAERSPNMAELFLAPEQIFSFFAMGGDVCAYGNLNPWGANPNVNTENWDEVINLCGQLMEASGNVEADNTYYGIDYRDITIDNPPTNPQALGTGFGVGGFPHAVGNPDLKPETADTWTIGFVMDSPFDNPWISDARLTIDYYTIEVTDAIGQQSADIVMQQCVDPRFNPTFDPNSPYCQGFPRTASGGAGDITATFFNLGAFETSGIDISLTWGMDAGPGRLGANVLFNYLLDKKSTEMAGVNPMVDYTGTFGPGGNGLNGSSYEWQALTTVSYNVSDLMLTLRWSYYDSLLPASAATVGTTMTGAPKYYLFDLLGIYNMTDRFMLRFGIENLFNKEPPVVFRNLQPAENELIGGSIMSGVYDTNGRRFYLGFRWYFD